MHAYYCQFQYMCLSEQFFHCHAESSGRANSIVSCSLRKNRGMVLPFEPYSITFDQILHYVDMPQVSHLKVITHSFDGCKWCWKNYIDGCFSWKENWWLYWLGFHN
ncbi:hypothetical protein VIGAN_07007400 [Vigna angularis var. angularis]|uniref:Uncharacterized protein n=1 Tax=Vigna angularis var. angularis TaxID=157739 RepID=A0A0S3SF68_PHAAN|nr:hypothetical protein VIGAN_07007400 [Vigna angularis var. angularis]